MFSVQEATGFSAPAVGFALSRFAGSLPTERRQIVGGLRVTPILLLIGLLSHTIFAPGIILGPR